MEIKQRPVYGPFWVTTLLCFVILASPILFLWQQFSFDSSAKSLLAQDRRAEMSYDKMKEVLKKNVLLFFAVECDKVLTEKNISRVRLLCDDLIRLKGIVYINSLTHTERPIIKNFKITDVFTKTPEKIKRDSLQMEPFAPFPGAKFDAEMIHKEIMEFPIGPDLLLSRSHEALLISVVVERELLDFESKFKFEEEVEKIVAPHRKHFKDLKVFSFPFMENELIKTVTKDSIIFIISVSVLIGIILLITFRSIHILLMVCFYEFMGLSALAALVISNTDGFNLYTAILIPLLAGLQLTFLSHFFSMWQRDWSRRLNVPEALRDSLIHITKPSCIAALTTSIGLLSLMTSNVEKIREFGMIGGIGVVVVFIISFAPFYLLKLFYQIRGYYGEEHEKNVEEHEVTSGLDQFITRVYNKKIFMLIIFIILAAIAIPALGKLNTDVRALEFLNPNGKTRQTLKLMNDKLGGINLFQLVIDCGESGGVDKKEALEYMEKLRNYANNMEGVSSTYCYSSVYVYLNKLLFHKNELLSQSLVNFVAPFVDHARVPELEAMITRDKQKAYFVIRNQDMPSRDYLVILEKFKEFANKEKPEGINLEIQKGIHTLLKQDRDITQSQIKSLSWSLLIIFLCLLVLWFSPRLAIMAILCNSLPLLLMIGLMGYLNISLNSVTVLVAAVVYGIAVDDAIHFLSYFKSNMRKGMNAKESLLLSIRHKLKPMACTSAIMVSALALFVSSSFPPIQNFGLLAATGLVMAFASLLLFIPAFIGIFYKRT